MESKTNYTLVGLVVLILIGSLLATGLWLSVGFDKKEYKTYAVYLHEAASGLSDESPVRYSGVQVGFVKKIELNQEDPRQVRLLLDIEEGTPITTSTSATLISQGITGVTYVGLSASDADLMPVQKKPGEPYPIIPSRPSLFNQLDKALKDVSENVNKVSLEIQRIFDEENATYIKKSLANIENITHTFAQNSAHISRALVNTDTFMANMAIVSKDLPEITKDLKRGLKKFNIMADDISAAGKEVSSAMKAGKTTINQISQQAVPPAVTLLRRLDAIAANLEKVSSMVRQNPAVIIRGSKPPSPGPGE